MPVLLEDPKAVAVLLLRARSAEQLVQRLEDLFAFWNLSPEQTDLRRRVSAVVGDVAAERMGLGKADFDRVTGECTHIIHSAGSVRMNLPIEEARRTTVTGAANIIEFAHASRHLKKLEFVSTVGVGGRSDGTIPEDWLVAPRSFHNTYEQAKAEAEDLLRSEIVAGLPATVHRPSMVVGNSITGRIIHFQVFYHLCEFLSGSRTFGLAPDMRRARLDIVPADYVARLIALSSRTPDWGGRILHCCSGPDMALRLPLLQDLVRQVFADHGRRLPPKRNLPTDLFRGLIALSTPFLPGPVRRAVKTLPVFLDYLATEQAFANNQTRSAARALGLSLPAPETYLDRVLAYYLSQGSAMGRQS